MKSKNLWLLFAMMGLFLFPNACVRYYKTSDIRKSLNSARTKTRTVVFKAQKTMEATKAALCQLEVSFPGMSAANLANLKKLLADTKRYLVSLKADYRQVDFLVKRFTLIAKNRKNIRADRPEWDKVQKIKAALDTVHEKLNDTLDAYNAKLREFKKAINKLRASIPSRHSQP